MRWRKRPAVRQRNLPGVDARRSSFEGGVDHSGMLGGARRWTVGAVRNRLAAGAYSITFGTR